MTSDDPRPMVAETLRIAASWLGRHDERDMLLGSAEAVEAADPDDAYCPLCQETSCDRGCPMETWRHPDRGVTTRGFIPPF